MYLFTPVNILCYLFVLTLSYLMIRGMINMLKFGKTTGSKLVIIALLLSPLSLWLFFQFVYLAVGYQPDRYFSSSAWKQNLYKRHAMSKNLLADRVLIGKDSSALKKMLGEPQIRSNASEGFFQWQYSMGSSGFFMFHYLIVKGHNNQVTSVVHIKNQD